MAMRLPAHLAAGRILAAKRIARNRICSLSVFLSVLQQWDQYDSVYDIEWDFSNLDVRRAAGPLAS